MELPNFDGPNDHEETNVGKNKYHFSRVIGYEELTVKISKKIWTTALRGFPC